MHKTISFYQPVTSTEWPDSIWGTYSLQISRHGVPYFDAGSELDALFQDTLSQLGFDALRQTIEVCTGAHLGCHPYHYLTLQQDRDYSKKEIFDLDGKCPGDKSVVCTSGRRQSSKIWVDPGKSKNLDIMGAASSVRPRLIIVSSRLRELLEGSGLTGFGFIPCLRVGEFYSDEEIALRSESERVEKLAPFFQLVATSNTRKPPWIGKVLSVFHRCRKCGTIYGAYFTREPVFKREDLDAGPDLQQFASYETSNLGAIDIAGERLVISFKFLELLRENSVRGLANYLTDPPVKHGIVELR